MPPANRNKPQRAPSSDSDYSVTEFMQEFPNDAACLEHLWRSRYSEDGEHAECPKCGQVRRFKRYAGSPIVDLHRLRASRPPDSRNDLP